MTQPLGDDVLVGLAARRLAVQAALAVALGMLLLVVIATLVVVRGQARSADTTLRTTVATADDVDDPPPGAWLLFDEGRIRMSPGLPSALKPALARLRATAGTTARLDDLAGKDPRAYRIATQRQRTRTVQVVLDLTAQHEQRDRLVKVMGAASLLAVLFAALLGVVLARRAVRPLAEALRLQRTFVADASHELRTPLTLLSTRAQLLDRALRRQPVDAAVLTDAAGVVADVHRLGEVVEDLLIAADPRAEQQHETVDLTALVGAVADSAQAHASAAGVRLVDRTEAGAVPRPVSGSPAALRRALLSLVDNAIDHTPAGGEVAVRARDERRSVVVSVSDTGPGVHPDDAKDVLRRFHSGGQRAGRAHYGLGLALTHDVANRHGGQLRLVEGGPGATFELVLPRLRSARGLTATSEAAPRKP